jgi:hypothetical protein
MRFLQKAVLACNFFASQGLCSVFGKRVTVNDTASEQETQRASVIKEIFRTAWTGYYENAFPADELLPMNNSNVSF